MSQAITMSNADMPAMPIPIAGGNDGGLYHTLEITGGDLGGLTKREAFAMAAMQGLCNAHDQGGTWAHDDNTVAETAVRYADELLKALEADNAN